MVKFENNTLYVTRTDVETFFEMLRQSLGAFKQRLIGGPEPELPRWVRKVHKHLEDHVFSYIKDAATDTGYRDSYKAGYIIGNLRWLENYLLKQLRKPKGVQLKKGVTLVSEITVEECSQIFERFMLDLIFDGDDSDKDEILKGFLRSIRKNYLHVPVSEAAEFFKGMADGFKGLDMQGSLYGKGTSITPIMLTLMICWPQVQEMKSIPQLHRWLCRMDGKAQVGELKRVEKICERIGLTLKGPGRPPKTSLRKRR